MSAALGLYRLQQVDSQIDSANARLGEIRKTLENNAEMNAALNRMQTSKAEHQRFQHELKNAEAEVQAQKIKIEQNESSLYGGSVKNPKELQDLQLEVASLKKYLVTLEERQLEAMMNAEDGESEMGSAGAALEVVQARLGNEHSKLIEEQTRLTSQLESLVDEREAAVAPVEQSMLQTYEALRKQKKGVAVAAIDDGICASCGTTITAAAQQAARSAKLVNCSTCGRILFAN